ncbi:MAG: hypothetical protein J6Y95_05620 [Lachnospiraceae bacterium]|nr:hypothetical protein [Lachnospiraceae bacterium]
MSNRIGLFFFPFSGLYDDKNRFTKACFSGLDLSHDRYHLARAVMEGVAVQICWMMEAFKEKPDPKEGIILSGGASKSPLWTQLLADISGLPIRIPDQPDLACIGAAILAGVGSGVFSDVRQGCDMLCVNSRKVMPRPETHEKYLECFTRYKETAEALGNAQRRKDL